jgi:sigma-B regulation protein RsbU (phosphoserine phosphatase)
MAMLRTILHGRELSATAPADVLAAANRHLCKQSGGKEVSFITAFYGIFRPADGSLVYASAGHNPPLLVDRRTQVQELDKAQALPLSVDPHTTYTEAQARLQPGDTLLLYTDGITEAMNQSNEMYGRNRLLSCVREDVPNAQHIIDCVYYKLLAFTGDTRAEDDRTLLALRVRD